MIELRDRSGLEQAFAAIVLLSAVLVSSAVHAKPPHETDTSTHASTSTSSARARTGSVSAQKTKAATTSVHLAERPHAPRAEHAESNAKGDANGGEVKINDRIVFTIRAAQGSKAIDVRARAASEALERAAAEPTETDVRVDESDGVSVVYAGKTPIVQLTIDDARAAGDSSISVHAAAVSASIDDALRTEKKRSAIANSVFSFSLLVFSGLIAFLVIKKLGEVAARIRKWFGINPRRLKPLRLGGVEVVSSAALTGGLSVAIGIGERIVQFGVLYLWLAVGLSLFESTRGYTEQLTGFVLTPMSNLIGKIGTALPILVVGSIALAAIAALVRFVALFFGSVARGETFLRWMPRDLAEPTSIILRSGIIISALIYVVPFITSSRDAESEVGIAVLAAFGLASVPVLASAPIGIIVIFARRLRIGDFVEIGDRAGRIIALNLLEIRLEDELGLEIRVPHLLSLTNAIRVIGADRLVTVTLAIDPRIDSLRAAEVLLEAARAQPASRDPRVEILDLQPDATIHAVSIRSKEPGAKSALLQTIANQLRLANIPLGRSRSTAEIA